MSTQKQLAKIASDYVYGFLDKESSRLAALATWDLWYGPLGDTDDDGEPWCGFSKACDKLKVALGDIGDVWIDLGCDYVSDKEPEGYVDEDTDEYVEPYLEETYFLDRRELLNLVFGELAPYVG